MIVQRVNHECWKGGMFSGKFVTLGALVFLLSGCAYTFKGSSVPPHLKTIAIPLFDDQSGAGEPGLRENFTTKLIERFVQDNSLEVADKSRADALLEGVIISMRSEPTVITQGETVSRLRLTMSVKASYQDVRLKKKMWDKQFTEWGEFESGGSLDARRGAISTAIEKLTEDILLDAVSGW